MIKVWQEEPGFWASGNQVSLADAPILLGVRARAAVSFKQGEFLLIVARSVFCGVPKAYRITIFKDFGVPTKTSIGLLSALRMR